MAVWFLPNYSGEIGANKMAEEIKLLPPGKREERKVSPWLVAGIGAGVATAAAMAIYALSRAWAAPPEPPPGLANLYGKVTDAVTGEAIPDVLVTLNGMQIYTDSGGNYAFTDLEPGEYVLQFSKDGYGTLVY